MGAWAPISVSKDIFIDEDEGFAAVNDAPLNALRDQVDATSEGRKHAKTGQSVSDWLLLLLISSQ